MDFVHDQMLDRWAFRILTVIDQWSRESVCMATSGCPGDALARALDRLAAQRGWPKAITVDNGTEFTSKALWMSGHIAGASSSVTQGRASPQVTG